MPPSLERELRTLEERLLSAEVRSDARALDQLLHDDFVEFGSSGRVFDKRAIIAALAGEAPWQYTLSEFRASALSDDAWLITYRLAAGASTNGPGRETLRSSIWKRADGEWKLFFHQGTGASML